MNQWTYLELEQMRNSREYQDRYPSGPQAESGVDFNSDANQLFSAVRRLIYGSMPSGVGNWYDEPTLGLNPLYAYVSGIAQAVSGVSMPTWNQVFDNSSGVLNVDSFNASIRFNPGRNWKFADIAGNNPIMTVSMSGVSMRNLGQRHRYKVPANINAGATVTIPNAGTYTPESKFRNLHVYRGGALLNPGSGVTQVNQDFGDYRELSTTSIVTNRKINKDEILQFVITG